MRVLVVEDDRVVQHILHSAFVAEGYVTTLVGTGREGQTRLDDEEYDALVLDLTLPDTDGIVLARQLRDEGNDIPILMLSARGRLDDRLQGFAAGADDYLVKPFAIRELIARMSVLLRRSSVVRGRQRLEIDDLVLDRRSHMVCRAGAPVHLTPKEFGVLELFLDHVGAVLSREMIIRKVWDYDFDGDTTVVDTTIKRLRRAIDAGRSQSLIETVRGTGYRLVDPNRLRLLNAT
jgi:two-component system OmpR family response regulator